MEMLLVPEDQCRAGVIPAVGNRGDGASWSLVIQQRTIDLKKDSCTGGRGSMDNVEALHMPYKFLSEITGGFSDECLLGSGTFGKVYKGKNEDGQEIAVKILRQTLDLDGKVFSREFDNLTKLKHPNIVRLVGFCNEDKEVIKEHNGKLVTAHDVHRALCFEYIHNGSLQKHLHDEHHGLDWKKRYKIIKGVCMGLKYLHMKHVHHLDLKPDNILLDSNMEPKIADFGLSRLLGEETTSKQTKSAVGTLGYCPPEFINNQTISIKFDIFSLGVIMIKIICGPAAHSLDDRMRPTKFVRQVHKKWRERLRAIQGYTTLEADCQQVKKCIEIALKCTDKDRQRRPNIGYIVDQFADDTSDDSYAGRSGSTDNVGRKHIPYQLLKELTRGFSDEYLLSHGTYGDIYKGTDKDGQEIMVKLLRQTMDLDGNAISKEFNNLIKLKHPNIVQLVGFCSEDEEVLIEHNGRLVVAIKLHRALCFEYLHNGSLEKHLYADTRSIDWYTRFKIIKGICQGLHFLHTELDVTFVHMDLGPESIWLDANWVPKIAEFGRSRLFSQEQSRRHTLDVQGQLGYMAPEYINRGEISTASDIYSLGIIVLRITTGEKCSFSEDAGLLFDNGHQNWDANEQIIHKYPSLGQDELQQVKTCIVIGLKCVEIDRNKRPSIADIVNKLNGKRVPIFEQIGHTSSSEIKTTLLSNVLLDIYPAQLRFPFKTDKLFSCPLRLMNMTADYVAARLLTDNPRRYMAKMPLCGVVPPQSTYTLVVTMSEQKQPLDTHEFLSLESTIVDKRMSFDNADLDSVAIAFRNIFGDARESAPNKVHELKLKVVSDSHKEPTSDRPFQYEIEVISYKKFSQVMSVDVHPVEPWIMTSHHGGDIFIWDYQEQEIESSFDFTRTPVYSAKFIERKQWLVAGDGYGTMYVYNYDTDEEVTRIEAHKGDITSLSVHPSEPLVISSSDDFLIKLWNWEKGWECDRIFQGHSDRVTQVNFNPTDTNSFASASMDCTIKIWNISSSESKVTLSGNLDRLLCVQNYTNDTRQYLVTGSWDGTAQIWDPETQTCVQTLRGHMRRIGCIYRHPELPVLITGSHDGTLRLWNCNTYRLENTIGLNLGAVYSFGYIESLRRVVVACHQGIAIVEMN